MPAGESAVVALKLALALAATILLAVSWLLESKGQSQRHARARDAALALFGALAFAAWWNFGRFHFVSGYVHLWEHYHYYLGAKYGPELGYTRLYECTSAADLADGLRANVEARSIRDLHGTNDLISTASLVADPTSCTSHFSPERWEEFRRDVRFFRAWFTEGGWERVERDHGYNATPVWAAGGRILAESLPLRADVESLEDSNLFWIALADPLLLVAMWGAVGWAFGWRALCVALVWWGTNFPARFFWNGGAMLRFDWLLALVAGICLLKREKPLAAGAALTTSALLRVFPALVIATLVLRVAVRSLAERRLALGRAELRFALGCLAALAVLLPAGTWATGSFLPAWREFAQNSAKQLATPAPNALGLEASVTWDPATRKELLRGDDPNDPFKRWIETRKEIRAERQSLYLGLAAAFVLLLGAALRTEPDWAAACLGVGLVVTTTYLPCYYYGFLLAYGLLWERHRLAGVVACALAAVTCAIALAVSGDDVQSAYSSFAAVAAVLVVTLATAVQPASSRAS